MRVAASSLHTSECYYTQILQKEDPMENLLLKDKIQPKRNMDKEKE